MEQIQKIKEQTAVKILILAESGFGKTTSLIPIDSNGIKNKGLNPEETIIITPTQKVLPIRNEATKKYIKIDYTQIQQVLDLKKDLSKANRVISPTIDTTIYTISMYEHLPAIKNIVIDDLSFMMSNYLALNTDPKMNFDKYKYLKASLINMFRIIEASSKNIIILTHYNMIENENKEKKYIFKMPTEIMDKELTPEGNFNIVLFGLISKNEITKEEERKYLTKKTITYPAKSPIGMFKEDAIPPDVGIALEIAYEYQNN